MDSVNIESDSIKSFLYHKANGFLYSLSEGTTDAIGYLTIDKLNNTFSGYLNIKAHLHHFSSNTTNQAEKTNDNSIHLNILFRAEKQRLSGDSKILLRFRVPSDINIKIDFGK